jgi:hypothetical protein
MTTEFMKLNQLMNEIEDTLRPQEDRKILESVLQILNSISRASMKAQMWTADPRELLYQLGEELQLEEQMRWGPRIHDLVREN